MVTTIGVPPVKRSARHGPVFFVILSAPRCGSWLAWTSLAQNPRVAVFGELFNDEVYERPGAEPVRCSPTVIACPPVRADQSSDEYLDEVLSRFVDSPFGAVGFKLLYGQSRHPPHRARLWSYLEGRPDVRVVHVCRANLLESFVSLKVALATDEWAAAGARVKPVSPIHVTPSECRANFEDVLQTRREIRRRFRNHPLLDIEYETDMVGRYGSAMERVQAFLGLSPRPVSAVVRKQATRPVSERVANYGELVRAFAGTRFAAFVPPSLGVEVGR